ncbi:MAG: sigma 54-interacting transcriptional regulator [Sporomusaceae bacterium]|nr:sigma 54-interacting transcriptional regulator [Sporomusaceae bacterium]
MSKIAFIAPDKQLFLQGKKIIRELALEQDVDVYLARLRRGIRLAKKLETSDVDVIVCRGGTAKVIIDSHINIPVAEIPITGQDLAQVLYEAKKITGLTQPKVALVAFSNMSHDLAGLSRIIGINLIIYPLSETDDISEKIEAAAKDQADIVVGGIKTVLLAKKQGLPSLLVRSGNFALKSAFMEAQKIRQGRKIEKERAQGLKVLIDYSAEGIIGMNSHNEITVFNPTAERLLNISATEVLGQDLNKVAQLEPFQTAVAENQELIGQIIKIGPAWISLNAAPIIVDHQLTGTILTFQDITRIQEMEAKIRNEVLAKRLTAKYHFTAILGNSSALSEIKRIAQEMAPTSASVLISGESGTGKELFAQSIHNQSQRKNGPFVAVNCAGLPPNLLESELFGYVEGAFTGATKKGKQGLFEMAHKGTIFLDEISEMDRYGQSRLLRVLQEKQVMRLGDDKYIPVDVRIIAATNKDLLALVQQGEFRQDIYYRLKVLTLKLPPLRRRTGDIKILAKYFLNRYNLTHGKQLIMTTDAYETLENYTWPGNVRELMHFIERLVIICNEVNISGKTIQKYWEGPEDILVPIAPTIAQAPLSEKEKIEAALLQCHSNITQAAALLQIDRSTLYRKLKNYRIEVIKNY